MYWKKFQNTKLYEDYVVYKKHLNLATKEIRKAKKSFEKKLSENIKNDPKSFYAYVRSKSKSKPKVGPLSDENKSIVDDDVQMCNILNEYFSSVFTSERLEGLMELDDKLKLNNVSTSLNDVCITEEIVYNKLCSLKTNKHMERMAWHRLCLRNLVIKLKEFL